MPLGRVASGYTRKRQTSKEGRAELRIAVGRASASKSKPKRYLQIPHAHHAPPSPPLLPLLLASINGRHQEPSNPHLTSSTSAGSAPVLYRLLAWEGREGGQVDAETVAASMLSSVAMGMGGFPHQQQPRGAAVFTAAQWAELEQQALIYKYLMAGVPVPPDLLLPIRPHSAAAFSFGPAIGAASSFYHHPSLSYYAYYGKKLDPEPWRCRRTDGKKWRCSKEAHPDSKYCERHMHRGRNRSRKPVESKSASPAHQSQPQLSTVTNATRDTEPLQSLAMGAKTHGLSLGGAGSSQLQVDASSYGSKFSLGGKADVGELSFLSGASGNSRGFTIDSSSDSSWHSLSSNVPPFTLSTTRDSGLLSGAYNYSNLEPSQELGQVTIATLSQDQERHSFNSGTGGLMKQENQSLRPFFDEWPATRDSWSEVDDARSNRTSFSTTQLSISIPRCD